MPYKSESIPIAGIKLDQRRKLSDEQRPTEHWTKNVNAARESNICIWKAS